MHRDEVDIDLALVRRLVTDQMPRWADLPITPVASSGTVNALYRLGDAMVARLPRTGWSPGAFERQARWLPLLAPLVAVATPQPLAKGTPAHGYPFDWGVYSWLPGMTAVAEEIPDEVAMAGALAKFVHALWQVDASGGPAHRRGDLRGQWDAPVRAAIEALQGQIDERAVSTAWDETLSAAEWMESPRWVHGDLMPANLVLRDGRLAGIIDWEAFGVGDPAVDLAVAWNTLHAAARDVFRAAVEVDEATWARGRGWALCTGLVALPYYVETNPELAANARFRIAQVLSS